MLSLICILLLSYLAGSIPTAVLASRAIMKDDIRNHGSRNAGATNVFRVMGWKPALFVVLIDMGKGLLAVLLITKIQIDALPFGLPLVQILAGVTVIIGHVWTLFAGFKGGKGVGTAFGVLVALIPLPALIALGVWIALVWITRIVSIGSIAAALALPVFIICQRNCFKVQIPDAFLWIAIVVSVLIVFTHRANIRRLIRGEENRFGKKSR